jgi:PAS domain S-box-containing protein
MNKARILIVEDEVIIAMQLESQLQSFGYEVTSVVNTGEKAIKKAEEDKPDLILMDIRINGEMDGIEAAEIIRNQFDIPVIFSTAYLDQERIERAKITMPFGYVLKPIQERDLKVTLEMASYVAKVDAERRKAEKETEKLNQTLEAAQEMAKVGYWSFNIATQKPTWSKQMYEVCGYDSSRTDLIYEDHKVDWHPDDWELFDNSVQECAKGTPYNMVVRIIFPDKSIHFINTQGFPRYDEKGNITELYGTSQDITQFKLAEESLKESEEKYRSIFENAGLGIGYYKPDGTVISYNKVATAQMDGSPEDFSGRHIKEIFGEEAGGMYLNRIKEACEKPETIVFEDQVHLPTGKKYFKSTYNRVCNLEGDVIGVQIIGDDITAQKDTETIKLKEEKRYRRLFESHCDAIYLLTEDGKILDVNDTACQALEYSRDELLSLKIGDVDPNYDQEGFIQFWKDHPEEKTLVFETIHRKSDGTTFPVEVIGVTFIEEGNRLLYGFAKDISDRKQADMKIKQHYEQFKAVFDNAFDGILLGESETKKLVMANSKICELLGYTQEELMKLSVFDIHPEKDLPLVLAAFEKQVKEEIKIAEKLPVKRKDGSVMHVDINSTPVKIGSKDYLIGIFHKKTN